MRVFVTGASGFIGAAIVRDLIRSGHDVMGLARSAAAAATLIGLGAKVHRGDVEDPGSLERGAAESDGVIHTAFIHDMSKFKETCEIDRRAIEALGSALSGSRRRFVVATGMTARPSGRLSTEQDPSIPGSDFPRAATDEAFQGVLSSGVNASLVRLPPMVHDQTKHGIVGALARVAKQAGVSAYVENGANRWPAVHRLDAAHLFKLVFEKEEASARYHAVGEEGLSAKDLAHAIGERLQLPVASIPASDAAKHFGWLSRLALSDLSASSAITQQELGWTPSQNGLFSDIKQATHF